MSMLFNALLIAFREIRRNLTRAFLTVLGVIIGVSAVISMVTLGDGTTEALKSQISDLGSNLVMVRPGSGFGPRARSAGIPNFTEADVTAIAEQIRGITAIAPVSSTQVSTIYRQQARMTRVTGSTSEYFAINNWSLNDGRFFDDDDLRKGSAIAVIGDTVREELFGDDDPIGKKIRVGKASLQIIGLLKAKGQAGMGDQDDTIIVPLTTLENRLSGQTSSRNIAEISLSAEDDYDSDLLISDISNLLRERRNLQSNQDDDFVVFDTRQIAETLSSSTRLMTSLLSAVAGVSLLVGGIGIMNIMLVSVTERTREIGIRLAIGATAREVLWQFLVEALSLSSIGGLIGIALAFTFCNIVGPLLNLSIHFNLQINLIAFGFSALVGIIFGFAPARRASKLDPIEALRHE